MQHLLSLLCFKTLAQVVATVLIFYLQIVSPSIYIQIIFSVRARFSHFFFSQNLVYICKQKKDLHVASSKYHNVL